MPDLPAILLTLAIVFGIITVVGHGIWVMLAAIFGSGSKPGGRKCVYCKKLSAREGRCEWCGRALDDPTAAELADLIAVERQLQRFRTHGTMKPETLDHLMTRLERYRRQLLSPAVQSPKAMLPVGPPQGVARESAKPKPAPMSENREPPKPQPEEPVIIAELVEPEAAAPKPPVEPVEVAKPVARPPSPRPAPLVTKPDAASKSWTEIFSGFMEERNIRWGELIGGLLFVCSSIALIVSLWEKLDKIPYFPFFLFVTVSSAVFGVGLYAHYRWKLRSTSQGMLVIATLLVPLNFVAMAGLSKDHWTALTLISEVVALAIFTLLVRMAAQVLVGRGRRLAVAAVIGNSAMVLVAARTIGVEPPAWKVLCVGGLSVALCAAAVAVYLHQLARSPDVRRGRVPVDADEASRLFTLLGVAAFAMASAVGLMVEPSVKSAHVGVLLQRMSILVALAAVPMLAVGLTVHRGAGRKAPLGAYRVAGTTVALVAMAVMLIGLGMAWPQPDWIIAVGLLNAAVLVFAAFRWRLPMFHAGAIACAAMAYLTAFHWATGHVAKVDGMMSGVEMLRWTFSARSGTALAGLFVVLAAVSEGLARAGFRRHGLIYVGGCAAVAVAGLSLVTFGGDAVRAAALYGLYGAVSLGLVARWRRVELSYVGLALLTAAPLWLLAGMPQTDQFGPLWAFVLAGESLLMAVAAALLHKIRSGIWIDLLSMALLPELVAEAKTAILPRGRPFSRFDLYRIPLAQLAELSGLIALGMTAATAGFNGRTHVHEPALVGSLACIAAVFLLLAWQYRTPQRTWIGSLLVLAGALHTLNFNYVDWLTEPTLVALLGHATLALTAAGAAFLWSMRAAGTALAPGVKFGDSRFARTQVLLVRPLARSAALSATLALPAIPLCAWGQVEVMAGCLFWLAALWLVLAWHYREAMLLGVHQAVLAIATITATTAWLERVEWVDSLSEAMQTPWGFQAYGIAMGLMSLAWIAARTVALRTPGDWGQLLRDRWSLDRVIRHAVVIVQFLAMVACLLPETTRELDWRFAEGTSPIAGAWTATAWMLWAVLALMLLASLWERWCEAELISTVLVAVMAAGLAAGRFVDDLAVASALRWGLAGVFLSGSIAVWARTRLMEACRRAGANIQIGLPAAPIARAMLVLTACLPVLWLTLQAAVRQLGEIQPGGPLGETFFENLGPTWSYLVPLVAIIVALVGHAIRERSAGYAFFGGLVLEMAVVLGYSLRTKLAGDPLDLEFRVRLLQWATIAAAVWALAWLAARKRIEVWRETPGADGPRVLMDLQIGMAWLGNLVLIGLALATLIFVPIGWQVWSIAAGTPLGWIALALPVAAAALRGGRLQADAAALLGMAALGLMACTVGGLNSAWDLDVNPIWGYRTLMLGWASYAVVVAAAAWWIASVRTPSGAAGPSQALLRTAAAWVRAAAIPAVLLGLKAAIWHPTEEKLWASAAIALASVAGATMAVWRRREGWAFAAALGVNLAASLVVCYFEQIQSRPFETWWLRLVQANIIAGSAVALVWLAARKRLYKLGDLRLAESPLLAIQIALPITANALILIAPVFWLIQSPARLPEWMHELGAAQGWIAFALAMIAAACYLHKAVPGNLVHVLGGTGLGVGVLTTCAVAGFEPPSTPWLDYHILVATWAAACSTLLGIGILGRNLRSPAAQAPQRQEPLLPPELVHNWLVLLGGLSVGLAVLHGFEDPLRPWWSVRAVTAITMVAVVAALWLRQSALVWLSMLLIDVAGVLLWWAWEPGIGPSAAWLPEQLIALVQTNAVCMAVASVLWLLLGMFVPADGEGAGAQPSWLRRTGAAHLAAQWSAILPGAIVLVGLATDLGGWRHLSVERIDWIALAAAAGAAVICLVERSARVALPLVYGLGLAAIGMALWNQDLATKMLCWSAVNSLAGFVLVTAVAGWLTGKAKWLRKMLGIRDTTSPWFLLLQTMLVGLTIGLAAWIAVDFGMDGLGADVALAGLSGRMAGPPAVLMLLGTAIVMAAVSQASWRTGWQHAAFGLGVLLNASLGCSMLSTETPLPWLHRSVLTIVAGAMGMLVAGAGLRAVLPRGSDWIARGRQALPALAAVTLLMIAAAFAQEAWAFKLPEGAAVMPWARAILAAALAGLVAGCICFAVFPNWDPLKQTDRQRQMYVYAAEIVCLGIGYHVRFTMPWLFRGLFHEYWMFLVMGMAFAWAGLSEWFRRRQLPVLSEPIERTCLLLPLLPAVGFWFMPEMPNPWTLVGRTPVLWFLIGTFYGVLAFSRRSVLCTILSVVTMNLGLWVALDQFGIEFLQHPQLWLIPAAVATLVAEYLNRDRITEAQSTAIRYIAMSLIYVASTADMYIAGVGKDWRLPLVLMVLSVSGVLLGILLRIRSFLYLGVTFLLVDIVSILWYAAVDLHQTWIWYASGVALGAAIIALFAVFEKRRNDVLAAVERLKEWSR